MLRKPQLNDVDLVMPLVKKFFDQAVKGFFDYSDEYLRGLVADIITNHLGVVLEVDGKIVGIAGGYVIPAPLNPDQLVFQEIVWYLLPEHRGLRNGVELYNELEKRCNAVNVSIMVMVLMDEINGEKVDRFYRRMGYKKLETQYIKRLT